MQDAFVIAAERWPRDGTPANPGAWIVATARNRAIDRIRREQTSHARPSCSRVPSSSPTTRTPRFPTSGSSLIFACCHPALAADAQVALTLASSAA